MQISKQELRQIIKEEVDIAIEEGWLDTARAAGSGAWAGTKAVGKRAASLAGANLQHITTGDEVTIPAAEKDAYKRNAAAKLLKLHRAKLSKNLENAMTKHTALVIDLNKDLKGKLRSWNLDQLPDVQTANQGLDDFERAIRTAQTSALGGLGNAAKYLIDPTSRSAPEATAPTPIATQSQPNPGPNPDAGSPPQVPSVHSRADNVIAKSRSDSDAVDAQLAAMAKKRAARSPRLEEGQELTRWKKRAGIKEK